MAKTPAPTESARAILLRHNRIIEGTTLDLPDQLMQRVKIRALRERKKLKDAIAEFIERDYLPLITPQSTMLLPA